MNLKDVALIPHRSYAVHHFIEDNHALNLQSSNQFCNRAESCQ